MDLQQYISSGILELYAAGALSESEAREVEAMAEKHPEVKAELDAIQLALSGYSGIFTKNPPPQLRQSIIDKIGEIESGTSTQNVIDLSGAKPSSIPVSYQRPPSYRWLMAAVWVFLVLNIIGNVFFYTRLRNTDEQMAALIDENSRMKSDYEKIKNDMDKKTGDMKMVMNRQNKIVDMKGMQSAPDAFATVYWNPDSKQVMLNIEKLPMPPKDMQYQLWALKDGKPVDAGVFDMKQGSDDMHMMPVKINDADAFAVTLEKMGGSPAPTLERLYVMGKI